MERKKQELRSKKEEVGNDRWVRPIKEREADHGRGGAKRKRGANGPPPGPCKPMTNQNRKAGAVPRGDTAKIRAGSGNSRAARARTYAKVMSMKTILTPVDFSAITDPVVAAAAALARAQNGRVVLLNVTEPPVITSEYAPYMTNIAEIMLVSEKAAAKHLARLAARLKEEGIESETRQCTGAPAAYILKQAEELGADFIVMGSHGHTAFYDLLVGSTTHGVLLKATCPVLVVPAPKEKAQKAKK